ncbi:MAG: hypothetical protein GY938_24465 [Ketobacter sp.]|nr:hypothetical protein [Ketobacter sp.]
MSIKNNKLFWIVVGEDSNFDKIATRHQFEEDASNEAKQRSQEEYGKIFYVLQTIHGFMSDAPVTNIVELEQDDIPF